MALSHLFQSKDRYEGLTTSTKHLGRNAQVVGHPVRHEVAVFHETEVTFCQLPSLETDTVFIAPSTVLNLDYDQSFVTLQCENDVVILEDGTEFYRLNRTVTWAITDGEFVVLYDGETISSVAISSGEQVWSLIIEEEIDLGPHVLLRRAIIDEGWSRCDSA